MAITKTKGDLGQAMIVADVMQRGYKVALPIGEDWPFDIIVWRNNKLERVQCKYSKSDGHVIYVRCRSCNNWVHVKYTSSNIDWLGVYDPTSNACYYVPNSMLGLRGRAQINLRLDEPKNNQGRGVLFAKDFKKF